MLPAQPTIRSCTRRSIRAIRRSTINTDPVSPSIEIVSQRQALGCFSVDQSVSLTGVNFALIDLLLPAACDLTPLPVKKLTSQLPDPEPSLRDCPRGPACEGSAGAKDRAWCCRSRCKAGDRRMYLPDASPILPYQSCRHRNIEPDFVDILGRYPGLRSRIGHSVIRLRRAQSWEPSSG